MKKIRINELARELEVKAHEILDRLPELGVTEKKTHSSSIDEDVAIRLRRLYGVETPEGAPGADGFGTAAPEIEGPEFEAAEPGVESAAPPATSPRPVAPEGAAPEAFDTGGQAGASRAFAPEESSPVSERPAAPVRPPLAGRPLHPPVGARSFAPPAASPRPAPPAEVPPAAVIAPGRSVPGGAKPLPTATAPPKPGQILSGPRQP